LAQDMAPQARSAGSGPLTARINMVSAKSGFPGMVKRNVRSKEPTGVLPTLDPAQGKLWDNDKTRIRRRVTVGHVESSTPRPGPGPRTLLPVAPRRRSATAETKEASEDSQKQAEVVATADVPANAAMFARKYRLDLFMTQSVLLELSKAQRNSYGGLNYDEFYRVMCRVFGVQRFNDDGSYAGSTDNTLFDCAMQKMYARTNMYQDVNIESVFEYQMLNAFSEMTSLMASAQNIESDRLVYELAKTFSVRATDIDHIKREFDRYDNDRSGVLEFDEFRQMIELKLKAKSSSDLPLDRVKKFWREIDQDGSGHVDFSEFTAWYLKYFDPQTTSEMGSCNLLESFYDGFNPESQRHRHLDAMRRRNTVE